MTRRLGLATKNENLGASWPQHFFLKVKHCWTYPVYKTSWVSLPAKQAINEKLPHDWSNFDLPLLKAVEHVISLMPSSCLSLTLMHAGIHANKLLITAQPIRNLRTPASAEMNKRGFLYSKRSFPSLLNPPPFPPSSPSPFRHLLCRLVVYLELWAATIHWYNLCYCISTITVIKCSSSWAWSNVGAIYGFTSSF